MKLFPLLFLPIVCACTQTTIGENYLGKPYILDPLGEGVAPDADPTIRFDAFDCTTFVETVLADGDVNKLNKIRYRDGVVDFLHRNHFIESEWIPNNTSIVENASAKYGKTAIRTVKINRAAWLWHMHNIKDNTPQKTVNLEYIPYDEFETIHVNKPVIVLFVFNSNKKIISKTGTDLSVRHMGFLLPNGMLRHASFSRGRVVDTDFNEYVAKRKKMPNNIGIVILEIK